MIFKYFTLMDGVAIWGAVTGSIGLSLSILRFRKDRPILKLRFLPKIKRLANGIVEGDNDGKELFLEVYNRGIYSTTLNQIVFVAYKNRWAYHRRKTNYQTLTYSGGNGFATLPYILEQGRKFDGTAARAALEKWRPKEARIFFIRSSPLNEKQNCTKTYKVIGLFNYFPCSQFAILWKTKKWGHYDFKNCNKWLWAYWAHGDEGIC